MWYDIALGIVVGLIFLSLIILFCFVLVKLHIRKIKNYATVIYEKDLAFQKTLNMTIIETQEQVLNNISQDLHDDAGQQLTYINFQIEHLKLDSPELQNALSPISESVGNLARSVRNISHSLNNQLLMKQDLVKAIGAEAERMNKNAAVSVKFTFNEIAPKIFSANEKTLIYRMFQEIVNNCFKHSKARTIDIKVTTDPLFDMQISDDGNGFDYQRAKNECTLGLESIANRAAIINYVLDIKSAVGKGTTVSITEKSL